MLYSNYRQSMIQEMEKRALAVAQTTATLLASEDLPYGEPPRALQFDSKQKASLEALLSKLRQDTRVDFLYVQYTRDGLVSTLTVDSQLPGRFPGPPQQTLSSACEQVFQSASALCTGITADPQWGSSILAHAPVTESGGQKVFGVVSAGFLFATLAKELQDILLLIIGLYLLTSILVSLAICIVLHLRERSLEVEYLTQLGTKQYFETQLKRIAERGGASKTPFSLLLLDIDGFKQINDTYGHLTGDRVLQDVATIIRSHVGASDICSRIGGDEFAVILTSSDLQEALLTAQAIQNSIQYYSTEENPDLALSLSIGVASGDEGRSPAELIEQADQALYKAKKVGKMAVKH